MAAKRVCCVLNDVNTGVLPKKALFRAGFEGQNVGQTCFAGQDYLQE